MILNKIIETESGDEKSWSAVLHKLQNPLMLFCKITRVFDKDKGNAGNKSNKSGYAFYTSGFQ